MAAGCPLTTVPTGPSWRGDLGQVVLAEDLRPGKLILGAPAYSCESKLLVRLRWTGLMLSSSYPMVA